MIININIIIFCIIISFVLLLLYLWNESLYLLIKNNKLNNYTKNINKYLSKRDLIPIENNYEIIKNFNDYSDYHCVIYWTNNYACKIIIRRLDDFSINSTLRIKIYDIYNKKFELFNIDKNYKNEIIINYDSKIELQKANLGQEQNIPKLIIQTSKTNKVSHACFNAVQTFIDLNPEYEYKFFSDSDCLDFIKNNFNVEILNTYIKLIPGAYKADLFRYCVLYIYGGCYFDIKQILRVPLRQLINKNDDIILTQDVHKTGYYNAIMLTKPRHPLLMLLIDEVVKNVKNNYFGDCPLCPTGPCLLYKLGKHIKPTFLYTLTIPQLAFSQLRSKAYVYYKDKKIITPTYHGYYKINDKTHYSYLWFINNIYKKNS